MSCQAAERLKHQSCIRAVHNLLQPKWTIHTDRSFAREPLQQTTSGVIERRSITAIRQKCLPKLGYDPPEIDIDVLSREEPLLFFLESLVGNGTCAAGGCSKQNSS